MESAREKAGPVPQPNSLTEQGLRLPEYFLVSLREDSQGSGVRKRVLVVVELDIRLIDQGDVEAEGEIAVGALREHETRAPAAEVALETEEVIGKLVCPEIERTVPVRRPVGGGTEVERQRDHLSPGF